MNKIAVYNKITGVISSVVSGKSNIERAIGNLEDDQSYIETTIGTPVGHIVSNGYVIEDKTPKQDTNKKLRWRAFQREADPLFFKWQRGEATREDYMAKVKEIKTRYPDTQ